MMKEEMQTPTGEPRQVDRVGQKENLSHPMDEEISHRLDYRNHGKRKKFEKRRKILKWVGLGVIILAILYVAPIPLGSMVVTGSKTVTLDDVKVAGNVDDPVNLLQVNTERLKQRLSHDLRVESVSVSYQFPLTMVVDVKDRKGIMILPSQFGYLTIDRKGQVIDASESLNGLKAPMVSGLGASNLLLGDMVNDEGLQAAVEYLDALPPETVESLEEINVGEPDNLLAYTVDGLQIRIGNRNQLKEKAAMTVSMLNDLKDKHVNAQYIDVNLDAPYIKELK